jgi:hypothetical protein
LAVQLRNTLGAPAAAVVPAAAGAPKVILSCTDKEDPTSVALLTVDSADGLVWQLGDDKVTTTLVSANKSPDSPGYDLHTSSGHFLHLALQLDGNKIDLSMGGLDVECDAAAANVDTATLDALVQATAASQAKQQPFATCQVGDASNPTTGASSITVRPALTGAGAILEGNDGADGDESFVILASSLSSDASGVTYKGDGGMTVFAAGQHVTHVATLATSGAAGAGTLSWSFDGEADAPADPVKSTSCTVTGDAIAKGLIQPAGQ